MRTGRYLAAASFFLACGCGSPSAPPGATPLVIDGSPRGAADAAAPGDDGSLSFATGDDGAMAMLVEAGCPPTTPVCPTAAPAQGDSCTAPSGFHCEYGEDPLTVCNTDAWCDPGHGWVVAVPLPPADAAEPSSLCPTMPLSSCPATFVAASSTPILCADRSYQCIYPEGTCDCDPNGFGPMLKCSGRSAPNCPVTRPRAGTPCSTDAGSCMQWGDGCGLSVQSMRCTCGTWQRVSCTML